MKKGLYILLCAAFLAACTSYPDSDYLFITEAATQEEPQEPEEPTPAIVPGIPSDDEATPAPPITPNIELPRGINVLGEVRSGHKCIRVEMNGISDNNGGWLSLYGTGLLNCNVWITVDDTDDKGIQVTNLSASGGTTTAKADISFLIDNSGSMSEEADAVANSISEWATLLASSGLDVRFSCVGYDGTINGGIDFSTSNDLKTFLDRSSGTSRTNGFEGANASILSTASSAYNTSWNQDECGVAALRFADENFTFRSGASHVYVNFTDEPNQPSGNTNFSVEYLNPVNNLWSATQGVVHSVYSDSYTTFTPSQDYDEYPWLMADYTGGTKLFTSSSFTGITLSDLPVTGSLQNTYIIYFTNIDALLDGNTHKVVITISTAEGIMGTVTLYINFSSLFI